jgi:hypothetical protein
MELGADYTAHQIWVNFKKIHFVGKEEARMGLQ